MRKPIIAGNWKMNKTPGEAKTLATALATSLKGAKCDVVICPPAIDIPIVAASIVGTDIKLGAQNAHFCDNGAYTGEVAVPMLKEYGVDYVIIGHSERRAYFGETDETVNKRALHVVESGLVPIICVGESLELRESGETDAFVSNQTKAALAGMTREQVLSTIIAYEPIWAIGTGRTASAEDANATISVIRNVVAELFGADVANDVRILYGGSMNAKNAASLMAMEHIDGGLIGGASLKAEDFTIICEAAGAQA